MSLDDQAIGQRGLRTAAAVVEQMLRLTRQVADGRWPVTLFGTPDAPDDDVAAEPVAPSSNGNGSNGNGSNGSDPGAGRGRPGDLRALRADAERLIELYGDWTRGLLDGLTQLAEDGGERGDAVVLGPVAPGGTAATIAYLHLLDGPLTGSPDVHATDATAHDRGRIDGGSVVVVVGDDSGHGTDRLTLRLAVAVPADARAGTYHGSLLVVGMPEVHLPLRIVVGDAG